MRIKILACKVLFRELSYLSAVSPNVVDITWLRQGLHNTPEALHETLQREIDAIENGGDLHSNQSFDGEEGFDAIVLGYALCSNATMGLHSQRTPLVIPRAHDCVTLFFGSKERYAQTFKDIPGCFWYTASWIDNAPMPSGERQRRLAERYREQGYDEDAIEFLLEEVDGLKNYRNAAYIQMPFFDESRYADFTRRSAQELGWDFHLLQGQTTLLERMVSGQWNDEDFLLLQPGETAQPSYGKDIICRK